MDIDPAVQEQVQQKPTQIITAGFSKITYDERHFRPQVEAHGKDIVASRHTIKIEEHRTNSEGVKEIHIRAVVVRSTSVNSTYQVELHIDALSRRLLDGRCSCPAGISATCKHAAAVIIFVNEERSLGCTDAAQKWKGPSKRQQSLYPKGESLETILGLPTEEHPTFRSDEQTLKQLETRLAACGLHHSAIFKCLTVDKSTFDASASIPDESPNLSVDIEQMFECMKMLTHKAHCILDEAAQKLLSHMSDH